MKVLKAVLKLNLYHLIILLACGILIGPLWFLADRAPWLYSCFMASIYGCTIYSVGWNYGRLDGRRIPGFYPNKKFPFQVALFASVIPILLFRLRIGFPDIWNIDLPLLHGEYDFFLTGNRLQGTTDFIYKTWFFPLGLFLGNGNILKYFLALLVLPVLIISGYFVGLTRFKLLDALAQKLIYSNKKKEN